MMDDILSPVYLELHLHVPRRINEFEWVRSGSWGSRARDRREALLIGGIPQATITITNPIVKSRCVLLADLLSAWGFQRGREY